MRYDHFSMLPARAFRRVAGRMTLEGGKDSPSAPDYTPMAEASAESARIMGDLGEKQLDFAKQQYEEAKPIYNDIAQQQMDIADQTAKQGQDYYNYLKSYRPTERSMMYESMGLTPDEAASLESMHYDNSRAGLAAVSPEREAEVAALYKQLGLTPQQITGSRSSTTTQTAQTGTAEGATSPFVKSLFGEGGSIFAGSGFSPSDSTSTTEVIEKFSEANPEYAATLAKLNDAQKALLAEQIKADYARESADLNYESRLSELGTIAAKRRADELAAGKLLDEADARIIGGQDADIYAARKGEIDAGVNQAIADTQGGYTRAINQAVRQGLRYGGTPDAIASQAGSIGLSQASNIASAANATRAQGINQQRGLAQTNMGLRRDITDNITKQKSVDWAKKLDATGLAKGMPGASQGAYGLAVSSGNSAGANTSAPGAQYMQGMAQGANTIGSGRNMLQSGLGNVLNAQTSVYGSAPEDQTAANLGAVAGIAGAVMMSDRRMKKNVVKIGRRGDGLNIYAFNYITGGGIQIGVMADEVADVYPDAVIATQSGYSAVNYAAL